MPSSAPCSVKPPLAHQTTDDADVTVAAGSIVENLNIIEVVGAGEVAGFVDAFSNAPNRRLSGPNGLRSTFVSVQ